MLGWYIVYGMYWCCVYCLYVKLFIMLEIRCFLLPISRHHVHHKCVIWISHTPTGGPNQNPNTLHKRLYHKRLYFVERVFTRLLTRHHLCLPPAQKSEPHLLKPYNWGFPLFYYVKLFSFPFLLYALCIGIYIR